ncbi:unnamed protein product [Moneuplotes crassus]|uniref:Uncharacterized protein n=1 Tax=Euplotes crassus TaxID=5936 RepID=A0AAD2D9C2_EUPCR|nr:unnamed protein product [Moneuplotes crassus]
MKSFSSNQDIWADEDQLLSEEECSPQIPKATKQFRNTLKSNKGKANKADFEVQQESTSNIDCPRETGKYTLRSVSCVPKSQFKISNPRYTKPKSQNYGCILSFSPAKVQSKLLRRIPSSDILKSLRS